MKEMNREWTHILTLQEIIGIKWNFKVQRKQNI